MIGCGKSPCVSCPYRKDAPSGIWHQDEYEKLRSYDGSIIEQIGNKATALFMCHQQDGKLCAGWVASHKAELLALRLNAARIENSVWTYESPVEVFSSGEASASHGELMINAPDTDAIRAIDRLVRKQNRRANKKPDQFPDRVSNSNSDG